MSVFTILSYINKVSVIAFFITTIVVGYQLYILRKEKNKGGIPSIPDFKEGRNIGGVANFTNLPNSLMKKDSKAVNYSKMIFPIITLMTVIVIVFVISLIGQNSASNNQALVNPPPATISPLVRKTITPTPRVLLSPTLTSTLSAELISPTVEASPSPIVNPTVEPTIEASPSPMFTATTEASPTGMLANASVTTTLSPSPSLSISPTRMLANASVTTTLSPSPSLSISPTEIILALAPSSTPGAGAGTGSPKVAAPKVLPETGSIQKGLMIIGVAISTIFFSFWL